MPKLTGRRFATSLGAEFYTDPALYERERKDLLGPAWQVVTHEAVLLPEVDSNAPATFVAETIAGFPCIFTRNSETGGISGHLNICRHRGGPMEWDGTKGPCKLKGFICKYHGWTYGLDGKLKGLPLFGDQTGVDKKNLNLWPVRVARWRGFVFAQIIPEASIPADAMFGEQADAAFIGDNAAFVRRMADIPLETYKLHSQATHKLACNWKVYVENYMEGYHIPNMHPELNKMVDMNTYVVEVRDGYCEHISAPIESSGTTMTGIWVWMSPTMMINCYGGGMSLERVVPTGPHTCEIRYQYLFDEQQEKKAVEDSLATSVLVTGEDVEICEAVQQSFSSGSYLSPGPLSPRHENGVEYFQSIIRAVHDKK
jgi:choline monooxygenase